MKFPLLVGSSGDNVLELKKKLIAIGILNTDEIRGQQSEAFTEATKKAVLTFQSQRGLEIDGICGTETWGALVESEWSLGDRLLYVKHPMLRGDDIASLQKLLGQLGFDSGRVDGIYGPNTANAILEFQTNNDIDPDKICGPNTINTLARVSSWAKGESVASVKDREFLRDKSIQGLRQKRIFLGVIADTPELKKIMYRTAELLSSIGAIVENFAGSNAADHAVRANDFGAEIYLGFKPGNSTRIDFFATEGFESAGGKQIASYLSKHLAEFLREASSSTPQGMRTAVLRETKMWSVVCNLAPDLNPQQLAQVLIEALQDWAESYEV